MSDAPARPENKQSDPPPFALAEPSAYDWPAGATPTDEYKAAIDYIRDGAGHLFVTGRAGTGKSTLLKCLR